MTLLGAVNGKVVESDSRKVCENYKVTIYIDKLELAQMNVMDHL